MRLREWIEDAAQRLRGGPHPERARADAEMLMMHQTGKNRAWLIAHSDDEFGGCASIGYAKLIERRLTGEPIQYIVGECEFYGLPFRVTRDVLIPRPETEHLVEKVIGLAALFPRPRIVDVGTGSGAIAVALACKLPGAQIMATDVSAAALEVARGNAERNGIVERMRFVEGDLLAPIAGEQFEMVVSNPPYVAEGDRGTLAVEVREYEPDRALYAGTHGLDIYRRLIPSAHAALVPGGFLAMEIGCGQREAVVGQMKDAGFTQVECVADLQGIDRVVWGRR
jgi:release factor glutamine methyltransferase